MGLGHCNGQSPKAKSITILVPSLEPDDVRWCYACESYVATKYFYGDAGRSTGRTSYCKACDNKQRVERERKQRFLVKKEPKETKK